MTTKLLLLVILILPFMASLIGWLIGRRNERYRDIFNVIVTGLVFIIVTWLFKYIHEPIEIYISDIMGTGLYLKLDIFRYVFLWITAFVWFLTTMYSTQYLIKYKNRNRYYSFFMLTLGSTIGIFLSENLINLFTFFEIMSFTSYLLVIHDEDEYAHEAGRSYISMAIIGGLVLLMGLFLLFDYTGTLNITGLQDKVKELDNIKYLITALIIIGFAVKASVVPLHVWLPKAHPAAPSPASAILSGILVKTGIFGIIIMSAFIMKGDLIVATVIIVLGFINMILGGFLALFQRNMKRILAYSSMSQVGYILVGLGLVGLLGDHNAIAIYGLLYHIFNHAIFKVLLFLCAGKIYMIIHDVSINKIRGFGCNKWILKILFTIGFFAIIGMPGFNGFISKTLLHEALSEAHHMYHNIWWTIAEIAFTIGSSFTVAYLLKIFVTVFIEEDDRYQGQYKEHIRKRAFVPMIVLSGTIIFIGLKPSLVLNMLDGTLEIFQSHGHIEPNFYTWHSIRSSLLSMLYGSIIFFGFIRKFLRNRDGNRPIYVNPSLKWFKLEEDLYIPIGILLYKSSSAFFHVVDRGIINMVTYVMNFIKSLSGIKIKNPDILNIDVKKKTKEIKDGAIRELEKIDGKTIKGNIGTEIITFSELLLGVRNRMNSIIYAVFIFAIMLVAILVALLI